MPFALGTFAIWTVYPLLWSALARAGVGSTEVLAHRIVGAGVWGLLALLVTHRRDLHRERQALRQPAVWALCLASGALIRGNWELCIWSAGTGHLVDASVGFFLTPLMAALFGVLLFGDKLTAAQRGALGVVALSILVACVQARHFPWVAVLISASNAGYVALRKLARVGAVLGLCMESAIFAPPALAFLVWLNLNQGSGVGSRLWPGALVMLAGLLTTAAMLGHVAAGKRLTLTSLGLMQLLHPAGQFALATLVFHESVTAAHKTMLACLIPALAVLTVSGAATRWHSGQFKGSGPARQRACPRW